MRAATAFLLILLVGAAPACERAADDGGGGAPEARRISGRLVGPEGPIAGGEVSLKSFADEACVELANATTPPAPADEGRLEACSGEFGSTTSDGDGRYAFTGVPPGWYKLDVQWDLRDRPSVGIPFEVRDGYLIAYFERGSPPEYSALAQGEIFRFSGEEDMVVDFDY